MADEDQQEGATPDKTMIAVINNNISYIQKDLATINLSLKELATVYVTREALNQIARETELRIAHLEGQSNLYKWISPIIASLITALTTYLIIFYLAHGGK